MNASIGILLPLRERYATTGAGAVSTVVDNFAAHGRQPESITVYGSAVETPLSGGHFVPVPDLPFWHGAKSRRYLKSAARLVQNNIAYLEVHNRPKYISQLRQRLPHLSMALYLHNDPRTMEGSQTPQQRHELLARLNGVVCVSKYIRGCFLEGLENAEHKVHVQLNAVDTTALAPTQATGKRKEIIFVGRTIFDKGPHLLVSAAEKVLPLFPDWKVVIVGGRYFGSDKAEPYETELFQRLSALGPQAEVTGYLPRQEALARLRQASIAVLPSLWNDPMPMAPLEAAACGCAVITTRRGGIPEGLSEGALYLTEETSYELERLLCDLLADPLLLKDWQHEALGHVVTHRDIRLASQKLERLRGLMMSP